MNSLASENFKPLRHDSFFLHHDAAIAQWLGSCLGPLYVALASNASCFCTSQPRRRSAPRTSPSWYFVWSQNYFRRDSLLRKYFGQTEIGTKGLHIRMVVISCIYSFLTINARRKVPGGCPCSRHRRGNWLKIIISFLALFVFIFGPSFCCCWFKAQLDHLLINFSRYQSPNHFCATSCAIRFFCIFFQFSICFLLLLSDRNSSSSNTAFRGMENRCWSL